jgi:hypothetical protein
VRLPDTVIVIMFGALSFTVNPVGHWAALCKITASPATQARAVPQRELVRKNWSSFSFYFLGDVSRAPAGALFFSLIRL